MFVETRALGSASRVCRVLQRPPRHARSAAAVLVTGVAAVLAVAALGLAGGIILAGGWVLAAGIGRLRLGMTGPASWAAAVVVETCVICGLSLLLALASPRPHGMMPNLLVLIAPLLLGAGLVGISLRWPSPAVPRIRQRHGLAAIVTLGVLAIITWVASRGPAYGVAWVMSGDARNHARVIRGTLADGGLTLDQLRGYPALVDTMASVVAAAGGRAGLDAGSLMLADARALATMWLLAVIALGLLLMAALCEFLPAELATRRRLPLTTAAALLGAAAAAGCPLVLGTGLSGGFVTGYGSIPFALAAVVLAMRTCTHPSPVTYALLGPATMLSVFGWTVIAAVPVAATVVVSLILLHRWRGNRAPLRTRQGLGWALASLLPVGAVVITIGIVVTQADTLKAAFLLPGTVTSPQPRVLPLLAVLAVALLLLARTTADRQRLAVVAAVAVGGFATIYALRAISPGPLIWTYYSAKALWLIVSSVVWVAFLPVVRLPQPGPGRWAQLRGAVAAGGLSLALLFGLGFTTIIPDPLPAVKKGWNQPTAAAIDRTVRAGKVPGPFLLWDWSDPGNDRLANFWAGDVWGMDTSGAVRQPDVLSWAYTETGQLTDLCAMAKLAPGLRIITRSPALSGALAHTCPRNRARVILDRG
jgi:hypothetical protein